MPAYSHVVQAQIILVRELDLDVLFAAKTCWACRYLFVSENPERAHIIARSHGGSDHPSNFFLLCGTCHRNQPDGASRQYQLDWIKSHKRSAEEIPNIADDAASDFERLTGFSLKALCESMIDKYGTREFVARFSSAVREGSQKRAGVSYLNANANVVALLVGLWEKERQAA